jgi:Scavenger mRNA decapping enzyme C-term binding
MPHGSTTPENCIFCKIARGEIPSQKVFEDAEVLAFKDVRPAAPVHVLLVPKLHIASLYEVCWGLPDGSPGSRAPPTASGPSSIRDESGGRRCIISTST